MAPINAISSLTFLKRDPRWESERPYELGFTPSQDNIPQSNAIYDSFDVEIEDIRDRQQVVQLDSHGFELVDFDCGLTDKQFNDKNIVLRDYLPAAVKLLKSKISAVRLQVSDFSVGQSTRLFVNATYPEIIR